MPESSEPASAVTILFGTSNVTWTWDPFTRTWVRTAYGEEGTYLDEAGEEQRVEVPVLISLYTDQYTARPPAGVSGTSLPASDVIGTGPAYVFADGQVFEGTWERESEEVWFTLLTPTGEMMLVPPGQSWLSLVPSNRGMTIAP